MIKKLRVYIYFSLILFLGSLNLSQSVTALDTFEYEKEKITENSIQKNIRSEYILGPGDGLFIEFQGINIFSGIYNIDPEGNIYLPEIKQFKASGLTANELTQSLIKEYKNFIIKPDINISLASYRPVTIYISGEIKSPGLYTLQYRHGNHNNMSRINNIEDNIFNYQISFNDSSENQQPLLTKAPKLFLAIQRANGVKNTADLGAIAIAVIGIFNILGTVTAGLLGGKFSKKYLLATIYSMRALLAAWFILVPMTPVTVLIFSAVMGSLWLATVPLTSGLVAYIYGLRYMGTLYGLVFLSHQIGSFVGVWLGGDFYDRFGSYDIVWWVGVGTGVLSAIVHLPVKEEPKKGLAIA